MITGEDVADTTAIRAQVADRSAQIVTNHRTVTDWSQRFFGSWWQTEPESPGSTMDADVHLLAHVGGIRFRELAAAVDAGSYETISHIDCEVRLAERDGGLLAYSDDVAYTIYGGAVGVSGLDPDRVAQATCRLAQEALCRAVARDGWVLLNASAVVHNEQAVLAFGPKSVSRTSPALQLARAKGWAVLANDRVLARPGPTGEVTVLPWPAAVAIGLGLLDAAGWYDAVAAARADLHPRTTPAVVDALTEGQLTPLLIGEREYKAQLFPDQLTSLLGLPLATSGHATTVLFPRIDPDATPSIERHGREIGTGELFHDPLQDRYPDVFGLPEAGPHDARNAVLEALNALPRAMVTLGHNLSANEEILAEIP